MKLHGYISKTLIASIVMVLLVFAGLLIFVALLGELGDTGQGQYGLLAAIIHSFLNLPITLYQIFPTIILIGVLIGLGSLATTNELTVIRTSGFSLFTIGKTIMMTSLVIIILATVIGERFAPKLATYAQHRKTFLKSNGQSIQTLAGIWLRHDNDFFNIATVNDPKHISGITYFHFDAQHRLITASSASTANLINGAWHFHQIHRSTMTQKGVISSTLENEVWPLKLDKSLLVNQDPRLMTLPELYAKIRYGVLNGANVGNYRIQFWSRCLQPLTALIMVLVAIPFIFGPLRSVSVGLRLLSGITVGLIFFILNKFLVSLGLAYQLPPLLAAGLLPFIFFIFSLFLFYWKQ